MKKIIKMQLVVVIILSLIYSILILGILTDIKYTIEAAETINNAVIETVYSNITKPSIIFFTLSIFLIVNSIILLKKLKKQE
jgi:hypothetical protein